MVELDIPKQVEADIYYDTYISVNRHNWISCDGLKLDMKFVTYSWYWHVNLSIFGVSVVDTSNYSTPFLKYEETYYVFFFALD